jgi:hypothetical protein
MADVRATSCRCNAIINMLLAAVPGSCRKAAKCMAAFCKAVIKSARCRCNAASSWVRCCANDVDRIIIEGGAVCPGAAAFVKAIAADSGPVTVLRRKEVNIPVLDPMSRDEQCKVKASNVPALNGGGRTSGIGANTQGYEQQMFWRRSGAGYDWSSPAAAESPPAATVTKCGER